MAYLFFQTWIWLLLATLFGFFVGWLIWGRRDSENAQADSSIPTGIDEPEIHDSELHTPGVQEAEVEEAETLASDVAEPDIEQQVEVREEPVSAVPPAATVITGAGPEGAQATVPGIGTMDEQEIGRPELLDGPVGEPDDLKRIRGVGPVLERTLNGLGIYHFRQIAAFTPQNIAWVNAYLSFSGRIEREDWVGQARGLAREENDDYYRGDESF